MWSMLFEEYQIIISCHEWDNGSIHHPYLVEYPRFNRQRDYIVNYCLHRLWIFYFDCPVILYHSSCPDEWIFCENWYVPMIWSAGSVLTRKSTPSISPLAPLSKKYLKEEQKVMNYSFESKLMDIKKALDKKKSQNHHIN